MLSIILDGRHFTKFSNEPTGIERRMSSRRWNILVNSEQILTYLRIYNPLGCWHKPIHSRRFKKCSHEFKRNLYVSIRAAVLHTSTTRSRPILRSKYSIVRRLSPARVLTSVLQGIVQKTSLRTRVAPLPYVSMIPHRGLPSPAVRGFLKKRNNLPKACVLLAYVQKSNLPMRNTFLSWR